MADFTKLNGYNVKDAGAGRSLSVSGSDLSLKDANGNTLSTVQMSGGGGGATIDTTNFTYEGNNMPSELYASGVDTASKCIVENSNFILFQPHVIRSGSTLATSNFVKELTMAASNNTYDVQPGESIYIISDEGYCQGGLYWGKSNNGSKNSVVVLPRLIDYNVLNIKYDYTDATKTFPAKMLVADHTPDIQTMNRLNNYYKNNVYIAITPDADGPTDEDDNFDIVTGKMFINPTAQVSSGRPTLKTWMWLKVTNNCSSVKTIVKGITGIYIRPFYNAQYSYRTLSDFTVSGTTATLTASTLVKDITPYLS